MEKRFVVKWEIDEFATNPLEAIRKAIAALPHEGNDDTLATVFDVVELDENGKEVKKSQIDVLDEGCNPFNESDIERFDLSEEELAELDQDEEDELQKTMDKCRDENF